MSKYKTFHRCERVSDWITCLSLDMQYCSSFISLNISCLLASRYANDPDDGARELASLLAEPKGFIGVQPGDLYGILIEHVGRQRKYEQVSQRK
jgi:hypothetical protein